MSTVILAQMNLMVNTGVESKSITFVILSPGHHHVHSPKGIEQQLIITARKRSLGQGNVFTPVCHSVHEGSASGGSASEGGLPPGGLHLRGRGVYIQGGWADPSSHTMGYGQRAGGTHPTGMHSCS